MKAIVDNKEKIHSNILHNSVDHILKSQIGTDASEIGLTVSNSSHDSYLQISGSWPRKRKSCNQT